METAELNEFDPLADCQLDTAEDYLSPITGNTSQDAGSSDTSENSPNQYTGSLDKQETGSPDRQAADKSEAAIVVSSTERAPVHAAVYPNFGSISPIIITENKRREQLPVLNLDAMEESDRLERGDRETTITTNVAGTELTTRTGHQYSQIPETHVETDIEELDETSREHDRVGRSVIRDMAAEPEKDQVYKPDLCGSRGLDDVIQREQEVRKREEDTSDVSILDVGSDQPSSITETRSEEIQPTQYSRQEVLEGMSILDGQDKSFEAPSSAIVDDREQPTIQENAGAPELDNSTDEIVPTLPSATIDLGPVRDNTEFQSSPGSQTRPARSAHRPSRYRDDRFETHFQPMPRRRHCKSIKASKINGNDVTNRRECFSLCRGVTQQNIMPVGNEKATPIVD